MPALMALALLVLPALACAAPRQALVIGNAAYTGQPPLVNTRNDARDMARALSGLGFTLYGGGPLLDLERNDMAVTVNRFLAQVQGSDGIALIYYSGHGLRDASGATYLVPTNARIEQEPDIAATGIALTGILDRLDKRPRHAVSLLVVDACRNNPFALGTRGARGGLGEVLPSRGTLVLYAASPGQLADDNPGGRNGLFTGSLLERLETPGLDIEDAFDAVSLEVEDKSHGRQVPWSGGNLRGKVYLAGAPVPPATSATRPRPPAATAPEMVRIQGGCFQMGSPESESGRDSDEGRHRVCVEGFELGAKEVTVREFRRFVEATGYRTDAERDAGGEDGCRAYDRDDKQAKWAYRGWSDWRSPNQYQPNQGDHPVACVSWNDAVAYIEWLRGELGPGWRLPTEAEWEYAARAGTTGRRYWGEDEGAACRNANVADEAHGWSQSFPCDDGQKWSAPVGSYGPNPWGLYDMLGNVWEWTCSKYDSGYGGEEKRCVSTADVGSARSLRGGSWVDNPRYVRAANRGRLRPEDRDSNLGFRLARTITP